VLDMSRKYSRVCFVACIEATRGIYVSNEDVPLIDRSE
jgi:hypothetical protein